MKKIGKYIVGVAVLFMSSCTKDFLTRYPIDGVTEETAFINNTNFQTYAWGLYDYMAGYGGTGAALPSYFGSQEFNSDNYQPSAGTNSVYKLGTKAVPTQAGGATSSLQISNWNFSYIRRVNVMLDHVDGSEMSQIDKDHWRSVGYFFRALRYYDMLAAFGDVPWLEYALNINDTEQLYAARTPRDEVAKNILNNLIWAEEHIKNTGDGDNTINVHVVRALLSRFGLFEGTWRKYHGLSDANTYLEACKVYSAKLLVDFPTIMSSYDDVYNSEDLNKKAGIILFKQYVGGMNIVTDASNNPTVATTHHTARFITTGSSASIACPTDDMVDSYLCSDGRPVSTSPTYVGDSVYSAFRHRDQRLYWTVCPPYRVTMKPSNNGWSQPWVNYDTVQTPTKAYNEYIRLMNTLAAGTSSKSKTLPMLSWAPAPGNVIPQIPHFSGYIKSLNNMIYDNGSNGVSGQAANSLGYKDWKLYNRLALDVSNGTSNDCPIFRIEEVMVNYAEAMFELGLFDQTVADVTINKLRARAAVKPMQVAQIDAGFDSRRDQDVAPLLWEIRRERRVELMGDGFRFNDIKRWKKGQYLAKKVLGPKVKVANYPTGVTFDATTGTTYRNVKSPLAAAVAWDDKLYLEPIPSQEMVTNPALKPNPGW